MERVGMGDATVYRHKILSVTVVCHWYNVE